MTIQEVLAKLQADKQNRVPSRFHCRAIIVRTIDQYCRLLEELNVTQPTLSHHMKILCDSGVVVGRKEGKWTHYSISSEGAEYAAECLKALTTVDVKCEEKPCCED